MQVLVSEVSDNKIARLGRVIDVTVAGYWYHIIGYAGYEGIGEGLATVY